MVIISRIEERMKLSKRQLATLDELELHLAEQEKISEVYRTVENDLHQLGYQSGSVIEKLRSGRLYTKVLVGENNFRHYENKKEVVTVDQRVYDSLRPQEQVILEGKHHFPFYATPLLQNSLLGVMIIEQELSKQDKQLLQEYAMAIGIELSPRYFRKEKDLVIQRRQEQLRQLMSDAVHDLKGKLTPLIGYATLLRRRVEEHHDEQGKKIIGNVSGLLERSVRELHYFQRVFAQGPEEKSPTNLYQIVADIVEEQRAAVLETNQIDVVNRVPPSNLFANVDATALELALREVLTNAFKYSPRGAEVSISGERDEGHIYLSIRNTGVSLDKNRLETIFEREHAQGTGLGLAFVKRVIEEEHQGKLCIDAEEDAMVVKLMLPV